MMSTNLLYCIYHYHLEQSKDTQLVNAIVFDKVVGPTVTLYAITQVKYNTLTKACDVVCY